MNKIYYENINDAIERNKPNISKTKRALEEAGVKIYYVKLDRFAWYPKNKTSSNE